MRRVDRNQSASDLIRGQMALFKQASSDGPRIGVLSLEGNASSVQEARRATFTHYGMQVVLDELSEPVELCTPRTMGDYDVVLFSATAPSDQLSIISEIPEDHGTRLIVGGQGAYSVFAIQHLADRVFFGRAEGAVDDLVLRDDARAHTWRRGDDLDSARYELRQAQWLHEGEESVGCALNCTFCQYTHTRKGKLKRTEGAHYNAGSRGAKVQEDTWYALDVDKPGRYTTAIDGWNQTTRKLVKKGISDDKLVEKLDKIVATIHGTATIKVFTIMGYPWETAASIRADIKHMGEVLSRVRKKGPGRVLLMFLVTPFSPEPLTPMENDQAVLTDWRSLLLDEDLRAIYKSDTCEAFVLPQINSPLTLLKRIAVNRGMPLDELLALSKERGKWSEIGDRIIGRYGWIAEKGAGRRVSSYLNY